MPESDGAELHQDRGRPVVPEDELGAAPRDRRLAAHRIPRDVELVRLVSDELHAGEEGGVVQGRRDLADAPSDRVLQPSGEDLRRGDEAVLDRALAERLVQREGRARLHDRPVEQLGRPLDVGHARLAALVVGRELRDELLDLERLGLLRRERGRGLHELRAVHRRVEVRGQRPGDPLEIERPTGLRRHDTGPAGAHGEVRVARGNLLLGEPDAERGTEALRIERDREAAVRALRADEGAQPLSG